ncbi:MAG: insulinase family protein [Intestinimonas sp.]|jgi:predicted Zn-dependent peptidase|nr:insulinase family protein [Intestinimonas sp.]
MTEKQYDRVEETLFHDMLQNGLHIYVDRKPGFAKSYAFFATNYGGMDMRFQMDGQWHDTPAGVAHFLEHKMFDTKDGNALQILSANGASPNAFTSTAITGYYFDSTEKFEENLKTLLSFVSVPWFTPESVAKEQGIIGQEIRMGDDDPDTQVFYSMLKGLYEYSPVRIDIAGTVESIAQITDQTLYDCHKAFYNPGNMVLCVAGDVDPQRVCALAREILPEEGKGEIPRDYGKPESNRAFQSEVVREMEVSTPIFRLGWKAEPVDKGPERLRQQLMGELVCEALLGTSSPLYARLYEQGLVNDSFDYGYEAYPGVAILAAGGESRDPWAVRAEVMEETARICREGIEEHLWRRLKKAAYGNRVKTLNSFESVCVNLAQGHFNGTDYLTFPEVYDGIEKSDVEQCIRRWITSERTCLAVIRPKGSAK